MKTNSLDNINFLLDNIDSLANSIQPLWHPLGFSSCIIREVLGELTLRVHFWPPNERRTKNPDWPIHTHSYTLSSLVLSGKVEDIQYDTVAGDEYSIYSVSYSNGNSEISSTDRKTSLSKCTSEIRIRGDQYRVERGVFHQSSVNFSESAVTFVALSEPSNEPPLVLGRNGGHRYPYDRTPFDKEAFWSAVRHAISNPKIHNLVKNV